jgi:PAS domain S-box-containing protein
MHMTKHHLSWDHAVEPLQLLVVDDDTATRENLRDILELDGHGVEPAGSVAEAVDLVRRSAYAAILMDRMLPDGTADDLLPRLRDLCPDTPVLVITGYSDITSAITAIRHGAADYLLKPINIDVLRSRLVQIGQQRTLIREKARAEQALRESEELLRAVVDTAADAIITIDHHGNIQSFNRAAERMFGYTLQEVRGRNVKVLMPPPYHDEHECYIARYLRTGEAGIIGVGREVLGRRKDGSTFPADLAVSEVHGTHERLFTGIIRDISERKELQKRILEVAAEEQRRIGHDLHDDVGQELTGLGLFAATARTALQRGALPQAQEMTDKLVEGVKRTLGKVRALSRGLNPVEVDSEGLMSALTELAARTSEAGGVTCTFSCPQPLRFGDNAVATHLFRIAQEATSNAVKHGRAAHVDIALIEEGGVVSLSVRDDGTGIDLAGRSEGLGLRIMRYRADLIHAKFIIESPAKGGTVVSCTLRKG